MKQAQIYINKKLFFLSMIALFSLKNGHAIDSPEVQKEIPSDKISALLPISASLLHQLASHQPTSVTALADLEGKNWAEKQAFAQFLPTVEATLSHGLDRTISKSVTVTNQSAGVEASVNLFSFGADSRSLSRAKLQRQIFQLQANKVIIGNERDILKTIIRVNHLTEKKSMWDRMSDTEAKLEKATKNLFLNGRISKEEFQKFEIDRTSLLARQIQFERQLEEEKTNLERFIKNANAYEKQSFNLQNSPTIDAKSISLVESWSDQNQLFKTEKSIELKLIELSAASADIEQNREKAKFLPRLDANASWVTSRYSVQNSDYSAFSPEWTAGLSLSIPLFSKLSSTQSIMTALAKSNAQSNEAESIQSSENQTKTLAMNRLRKSVKLSSIMIVNLESSNDLLKFEESRFLAGRSTVNEFAQNQRRAIEVMDSTYDALELFWLDLQGLCGTFGLSMDECLN